MVRPEKEKKSRKDAIPRKESDQSYLYALAHRLDHRKRTFGLPFYRNPNYAISLPQIR